MKMLLPILLVLAVAVAGLSVWLGYSMAQPPRHPYLVTPEKFSRLSDRGVKVTDEKWANPDGTEARGWLLRGAEGSPAVVLLHRYGADRSWLLNLGVKLNEATNYTILWPDLRGHGEGASVKWTSFGTREAEDMTAALDYLGTLKNAQGRPLVGDRIGIYGVEMGGYAALLAASRDTGVRVLALDSFQPRRTKCCAQWSRSARGLITGCCTCWHRAARGSIFWASFRTQMPARQPPA